MICPRCNIETRSIVESGVNVNFCDSCSGMYLNKGELQQIATPVLGDIEYCSISNDSNEHEDKYKVIECPSCHKEKMEKVNFNIYTDIILDYCKSCEGFWLDGGELKRINDEVRQLSESAKNQPKSNLQWFAEFLWRLPI